MLTWLLACNATTDKVKSDDTATDSITTIERCFAAEPWSPLIVHSSPYDEDANQNFEWQAWTPAGHLDTFELGRATIGEVQISSDGHWAAVAQENGTLGLFTLHESGVEVLEAQQYLEHEGETIYASHIYLDSERGLLWVTDGNLEYKGGLYRIEIYCDTGAISAPELIVQTRNGHGVIPTPQGYALLARNIPELDQQVAFYVHNHDEIQFQSSGSVFPDDEAIISGGLVHQEHLLVGDNNAFSETGNRVVHVKMVNDGLESAQVLDIEDPMGFGLLGDLIVISSGFGNTLYTYEAESMSLAELNLSTPAQLPSVIIGTPSGLAVAEYNAVRLLTLSNGQIEDRFILEQSGLAGIIGAVGVIGEW